MTEVLTIESEPEIFDVSQFVVIVDEEYEGSRRTKKTVYDSGTEKESRLLQETRGVTPVAEGQILSLAEILNREDSPFSFGLANNPKERKPTALVMTRSAYREYKPVILGEGGKVTNVNEGTQIGGKELLTMGRGDNLMQRFEKEGYSENDWERLLDVDSEDLLWFRFGVCDLKLSQIGFEKHRVETGDVIFEPEDFVQMEQKVIWLRQMCPLDADSLGKRLSVCREGATSLVSRRKLLWEKPLVKRIVEETSIERGDRKLKRLVTEYRKDVRFLESLYVDCKNEGEARTALEEYIHDQEEQIRAKRKAEVARYRGDNPLIPYRGTSNRDFLRSYNEFESLMEPFEDKLRGGENVSALAVRDLTSRVRNDLRKSEHIWMFDMPII